MEWVETTAKTVDEARNLALDELGVGDEDAEFEVLEEPRAGLFGLIRGEARVRARIRPTAVRPKQDRRRGRRERGDDESTDSTDAPVASSPTASAGTGASGNGASGSRRDSPTRGPGRGESRRDGRGGGRGAAPSFSR